MQDRCDCIKLPERLTVGVKVIASYEADNIHTHALAVFSKHNPQLVLQYVVQSHRRGAKSFYRYRVYPGFKYLQAACSKVQNLNDVLRHKRWIDKPFWFYPKGNLREFQFNLEFAEELPPLTGLANFEPLRGNGR